MLLIQPNYYDYVGSPRSAKHSAYYSQEFVNPTGIYEAYDVSHTLLWINGVYLSCLVAFLGLALFKGGF
jgi:hypothetical protein